MMDYRKRLQEIAEFLQPYQKIWQNEIMLTYPTPTIHFPQDWVAELSNIKETSDVLRLEKKDVDGLIHLPELKEFYRRIKQLSVLPALPELPPMPENSFTFLYVIPKKQYEIRRLAPFVNQFSQEHQVEAIIDIGGGIGILAQTLSNQYNLKVISLDMDPVLQETGRKRHEKNCRHPDNKVNYQLVKVEESEPKFRALLKPNLMTLGLHACGKLSLDQIFASSKNEVKNIINFGCCYYKLSQYEGTQNISSFAQSLPSKVEQSPYALTLATRGHHKIDVEDYLYKVKVKYYRYAMHFLLFDEYQLPDVLTLGNTHHRLYEESFGTYALEQLKRINVTPKHTKEELDQYFAQSERQNLIWEMLAAGLIRNALGRLLEIYLLMDRAIYLEEQGYKSELMEFFDEQKSPRNVGLVATKN